MGGGGGGHKWKGFPAVTFGEENPWVGWGNSWEVKDVTFDTLPHS
jgi:hypothetical protein